MLAAEVYLADCNKRHRECHYVVLCEKKLRIYEYYGRKIEEELISFEEVGYRRIKKEGELRR